MAAVTRRQYKGAAASTTTTNSLTSIDTSVTLAATTGWPSTAAVPFYVVIDPGNSSEEKCSVTISGSTLTLTRGADDTTAVSHSSGATIYPVFSADEADEANELASKLTTKGDLLATDGSALNRLAVGANGSVLMADSAQTNGVAWVGNGLSNRNKIINGDFKVWQRGTSYTVVPANYGAADRYIYWHNGSTAGTNTVSQQTFTPGAAPVAGYESEFFQRITTTTLGTSQTVIDCWQRIEDVRTFAGQSVTVSFWAKTSGTFNLTAQLGQRFGSGGSGNVDTTIIPSTASSGSWTRYSGTATLPSISGKTVGSSSYLQTIIRFSSPTNGATFDIWGVQVEAGSVATPFESEDIGTTLAKCQRYYERATMYAYRGIVGQAISTTAVTNYLLFKVTKRASPTMSSSGTFAVFNATATGITATAVAFGGTGLEGTGVDLTVASGLVAGNASMLYADPSATLIASAEL